MSGDRTYKCIFGRSFDLSLFMLFKKVRIIVDRLLWLDELKTALRPTCPDHVE